MYDYIDKGVEEKIEQQKEAPKNWGRELPNRNVVKVKTGKKGKGKSVQLELGFR